jgi:hypothetical protein
MIHCTNIGLRYSEVCIDSIFEGLIPSDRAHTLTRNVRVRIAVTTWSVFFEADPYRCYFLSRRAADTDFYGPAWWLIRVVLLLLDGIAHITACHRVLLTSNSTAFVPEIANADITYLRTRCLSVRVKHDFEKLPQF